ncbi:hypothetical protein HPB50_006532 [Hyalomma asiaticum]|uniref:Uncharacterized protein n=1 Tax=Hyalomma asiaticum TaxID=266040 RepID=A0ACB7SVI3_HYAAI|nr:hypothetical protein HPB50_006532 [Hyalomma asiaticum]
MTPFEAIPAQQVTFPGFFVVEKLKTTEDDSSKEHPQSSTFSSESVDGQGRSGTYDATTSHLPLTVSGSGSYSPAPTKGRRNVRGPDSSARSISSLAPYWVPKEIKHYFRNYSHKNRGGGSPRRSSPKAARSARRKTLSPESSPSRVMPRHVLLPLLAVAVTVLLVGVSADIYSTFWHGPRSRRHHVHPLPAPLEPFQKSADVEPALSREPYRNGQPATRYLQDHRELPEYTARLALRLMKSTAYSLFRSTKSSVEETTEAIAITSTVRDNEDGEVTGPDSGTHTAENFDDAAVNETGMRSRCGTFAFTYCHNPRNEFFYKRSVNACVEVATDMVGLCVSGRNRFTSKRSCRQACIDAQSSPEHCLVDAVFRRCETQDVTGQWWHFDGRSCLRWNFPSGLCPSYHSDVFSSRRDCRTNCVAKPRKRLCRTATPDVCYSAHLRFPYFAAGGSVAQCLKVSSLGYPGHRCLVGANRFQTMRACQEVCVSSTKVD